MPPYPTPPGEADPLLYFSTEQKTDTPSAELVVDATTSEDSPGNPPAQNPLSERLETVERDLAKASAEVALLRSDVATLVRVVDDIRSRKRQLQAATPAQSRHLGTRTAAAAIAGLVLGTVAGAWLWTYTRASAEPINPAIQTPTVEQASADFDQAAALEAIKSAAPAPVAIAEQTAPKADPAPPVKAAVAGPVNYVGTLSIDGEPSGEVFVDRQSVGRTPVRLEKLKAGSHLIWIEREGYHRWTRVVQVPSDRITRLWADLEPLTSR